MNQFIKVTCDGESRWINVQHIISVKSVKGKALIQMTNGSINTDDPIDQLLRRLFNNISVIDGYPE